MAKLILLRHGESDWNKKNLFTGWVDIPLSTKGIEEALSAGKLIQNMPIDIIYCSTLVRGIMTAMLAMSCHNSHKTPVIQHTTGKLKTWAKIYSQHTAKETIPVICNDALNERMYGNLQGLNKNEMRKKFGEEQVQIWRRSYAVAPPHGESLQMTAKRSIPYFKKRILPHLQKGEHVFISAHGNSLRSIMKVLDDLTDEEVVKLELATGVPILYDYKNGLFKKVSL